jgi:hypothetical protein
MNFKPKNDAEINSFDLFPKGEYDFKVLKAKDKVSQNSGNEMIELELDIYSTDGKTARVYDYLLESVAYKLKHFCQAVKLITAYETGNLDADMCIGRTGRCLIEIKQDRTGAYSDKNVVKDYCRPEDVLADIDEDKLPF